MKTAPYIDESYSNSFSLSANIVMINFNLIDESCSISSDSDYDETICLINFI